jgi:hypothetical protein
VAGTVEMAIRARVRSGMTLRTPSRGKPFEVERIDSRRVVLLLGAERTATPIAWECWEGIPDYLRSKGGQVDIGGQYKVAGNPGTLDAYLKPCAWGRATAGWVAAVLEDAGVVDIIRTRPARVRLRPVSDQGATRSRHGCWSPMFGPDNLKLAPLSGV